MLLRCVMYDFSVGALQKESYSNNIFTSFFIPKFIFQFSNIQKLFHSDVFAKENNEENNL